MLCWLIEWFALKLRLHTIAFNCLLCIHCTFFSVLKSENSYLFWWFRLPITQWIYAEQICWYSSFSWRYFSCGVQSQIFSGFLEFQLKENNEKLVFFRSLNESLDLFPDDIAKNKILPKLIHVSFITLANWSVFLKIPRALFTIFLILWQFI